MRTKLFILSVMVAVGLLFALSSKAVAWEFPNPADEARDRGADFEAALEQIAKTDGDLDGVKNEDDNCPALAGDAANSGCPDTHTGIYCETLRDSYSDAVFETIFSDDIDCDFVKNADDLCDDTAGPIDRNGCAIAVMLPAREIAVPRFPTMNEPPVYDPGIEDTGDLPGDDVTPDPVVIDDGGSSPADWGGGCSLMSTNPSSGILSALILALCALPVAFFRKIK